MNTLHTFTRRRLLGGAALWPLAGRAPAAEARPADEAGRRFDAIAARYFADKMDLDPLTASATVAAPQYEGRLAITIAPAAIAQAHALNARVLRELRALPAERLDAERRLSHQLLRDEVQLGLDGETFPAHLVPIDHFGGVPLLLANLGTGDQAQPLSTAADYEHYRMRLQRLPAFNRQTIANLREGIARGVTVPRALIVSALPTFRTLAGGDFASSPFAQALRVMPARFSAAQRARITRAYRQLFERQLLPSLRSLLAFLEGPYLAACRSSDGLGALPDGAAWYAYLIRFHTTTTMAPDELHALGLAEVARVRGEMARVQAHYGVAGSVTDFLRWHAQAPRFRPFTDAAQILAAFRRLNEERVAPQLPRLFGRAPKLPLQLREIPPLQQASASPYYNPPSPDGRRPGIFFVGASEPAKFNDSIVTSLLLHEGQPGHHYQMSLQVESALPDFRRYGWSTAFGEGWALYAETLGRELGLYEDPNAYLGHLKLELLRAVRLVTDTGLHAFGWSRERTMRYMMDTEGASEQDAKMATERYMAAPGQALAYKVGALKIQALRQQAGAALGSRFSLAAFHDLLLSQGTLPLPVLQQVVEGWIAAQPAA